MTEMRILMGMRDTATTADVTGVDLRVMRMLRVIWAAAAAATTIVDLRLFIRQSLEGKVIRPD